jgi:putative photosynthetic complex assembly protein
VSEPGADRSIPRGVLWGAAALIGFTIVSAGAARVGVIGPEQRPAAEAAAIRDLRFKDRADGAVTVHEASDDRLVAVLPPGGDGFIRGAMRGLARERRQKEVGPEPPFRLTRWDNGRLSLEDTGTGRRVDLEAFGPTNAQAFGRLLTAEAAP